MDNLKRLRIAVLTDCHAFTGRQEDKGSAPSWLDLTKNQSDAGQNPFAGLDVLAARDPTVRADIVLCCGDLGDKANPDGLQYVWREVNRLKVPLEADVVLGTAGNHDMDSRHVYNDHDARSQVQGLQPLFPIDDERHWLEYWAKNFTIFNYRGVRIVILNTAAYHGYAKDPSNPEYAHGRVSDGTITRLLTELNLDGAQSANLLICHHHPFRNSRITDPDYSEMTNGDQLINRIVEAHLGPWLVIHGHKHSARVFYAFGSSSSPTVFAAASFAARAYPNQISQTHNEFYIVDLEIPSTPGATSSLKGRIRTWNWTFGNGWRKPQVGEGLGPNSGFGSRSDIAELASSIAQSLVGSNVGQTLLWTQVESQFPMVRHLIPEDFDALIHHLTQFHGFGFTCDLDCKEIAEVQVP
jgi:3',5'-cyclic AMP phosphodiesterase CpdA